MIKYTTVWIAFSNGLNEKFERSIRYMNGKHFIESNWRYGLAKTGKIKNSVRTCQLDIKTEIC